MIAVTFERKGKMKQMSFILESRVSGHCYISFDVRQLFFKFVTNSRYIIKASTFVYYGIVAKFFSMIGLPYFVDVLASLPVKTMLPLQHRDNTQYWLPEGSETKFFSRDSLQNTRVSAFIYCLMKWGTIMAQYTLKICHYDFVSAELVH